MDIRNFFGGQAPKKKAEKTPEPPKKKEKKKQNRTPESKDKKDKKDKKIVKECEENNNHNEINKGSDKKKRRDSDQGSSGKRKKNQISSDEDLEEIQPRSKKQHKVKKRQIVYDSDSEEEPSPPKQTKKRKNTTVIIDSDDEYVSPKKERKIEDAFKKVTPPSNKKSRSKKDEKVTKSLISAADFFGGAQVRRKERPTPSKPKQETKIEIDDQIEIQDDSDFEETLQMLDDSNKKKKHESGGSKSNKTEKNKDMSLASKLAGKLKKDEILVPDTPEKKVSPKKKEERIYLKETPKAAQIDKPPIKVRDSPAKKASPGKTTPKKSPPADVKKTPSTKTSPGSKENSETPQTGKKGGGAGYRAYLHRDGPRALGSKEIPEGGENCLEGLTFVITGVLESLERDEAKSLVEKYGGKVTTSISKKTNYIVLGRDPGESKAKKAVEFKTKQLDEDALIDLIRTLPGKKSKYVIAAEAEAKKAQAAAKKTPVSTPKSKSALKELDKFKVTPSKSPSTSSQASQSTSRTQSPDKAANEPAIDSLLWVDKYKPSSLKQIIGQQGDKSCAKKLLSWLRNWHRNVNSGKKPSFNKFNDDGSGCRAALLSGPPGVGKTTTATLVCKESGFSFFELNASDTRSKKSLQQEISEALGNHSLSDFFTSNNRSSQTHSGHNHCLIMDEVDGMAGNEDRGGMQELIQLIKHTKIPIICMCNDRQHTKVRSLANHCFDLRFQRPRLEQIKAAMMSMAYKEGLKVPPNALNEMIAASNQDVRQVIHNLSMWSAKEKNMTYEQIKEDASKAKKDMKLGPFDVCRKVFAGGEETRNMTIHDKSDLFFHDYSIGPLFVQENYISVSPYASRGDVKKTLKLLSKTADSLCTGDLIERGIRSQNNWSLLPLEAMFASVIPGELMRGTMQGMINFPSWLGKNSSKNKTDRMLQELKSHMRLNISGDKGSLNQDYLPHLRNALTRPLISRQQEGVPEVVQVMDTYDLIREDVDSIMDVTKWSNNKDPMSKIDSKVKAAFTRTYNKESHMTPYSINAGVKKSKKGAGSSGETEGLLEGEEEMSQAAESDEEDKDDIKADAMIKQKKTTAKGKGKGKESKTKPKTDSSKGKGRGKKSKS